MITKEEMCKFRDYVPKEEGVAYQVTAKEMAGFDDNRSKLASLLADRKKEYEKENGFNSECAYTYLEEECQISEETIRKTITSRLKATRNFLYKFTVGLEMSIEEADEFFVLCGGKLDDSDPGDYICRRALRDGDDIFSFINQYEEYVNLKISLRQRRAKK